MEIEIKKTKSIIFIKLSGLPFTEGQKKCTLLRD